jgi:hypothetical protein
VVTVERSGEERRGEQPIAMHIYDPMTDSWDMAAPGGLTAVGTELMNALLPRRYYAIHGMCGLPGNRIAFLCEEDGPGDVLGSAKPHRVSIWHMDEGRIERLPAFALPAQQHNWGHMYCKAFVVSPEGRLMALYCDSERGSSDSFVFSYDTGGAWSVVENIPGLRELLCSGTANATNLGSEFPYIHIVDGILFVGVVDKVHTLPVSGSLHAVHIGSRFVPWPSCAHLWHG